LRLQPDAVSNFTNQQFVTFADVTPTKLSAEEEKAEVGRFSKNFLPILFNVYSQQPAAGASAAYRMAVLDTIRVYLTVTQTQMSCTFLQKATEKLSSADTCEFTR
ncbi:hypothetical protein LDENG_00272940, partial [Lucifuga dentata]